MEVTAFSPDDSELVAAYAEVRNRARAADAPWVRPVTHRWMEGALRHGWDGEPHTPYLATVDGVPVAAGSVSTSEWDNRHLAWVGVEVDPAHRRRGLGSELLEAMLAESRARGRTVAGIQGWDSEATRAFASGHGFELKSRAINRRQQLAEVDWDAVERRHDEALARAAAYDVVRRVGRTPDEELAAVATMSASINDAPTDDLDVEDEVYSPDRVRAYEDAQEGRGLVLHRVLARHRTSGELAGHSVVAVDSERPELGEQHDTAVVASHRGHRLGVLLKTEMNLWLREAQPQLGEVDTWNAESNDLMIGVNDAIGYRVMGRELELQRPL